MHIGLQSFFFIRFYQCMREVKILLILFCVIFIEIDVDDRDYYSHYYYFLVYFLKILY